MTQSAQGQPRFITVEALAGLLGGQAEGDLAKRITGIRPLDEAGPEDVTFAVGEANEVKARASQAGCIICKPGVAMPEGRAVVRHASPYEAFAYAIETLRPKPPALAKGIHPQAVIAAGAKVDPAAHVGACAVIEDGAIVEADAVIGPLCYVGHGAKIGKGALLHPRSVVLYGCEVGARSILQAGAVIGSDGFGFTPDPKNGRHIKIPQVGNVVVEEDVEVGANTTIDRAVLGTTRVGRGTKMDNQVHVAHNVEIGPCSLLVAQCGIAGSAKLGSWVTIAAQAGLVNRVKIGDRAIVGASAGVTKDVPADAVVLGQPAIPIANARRAYAIIERLPDMKKGIWRLEKEVAALKAALAKLGGEVPGGTPSAPAGDGSAEASA